MRRYEKFLEECLTLSTPPYIERAQKGNKSFKSLSQDLNRGVTRNLSRDTLSTTHDLRKKPFLVRPPVTPVNDENRQIGSEENEPQSGESRETPLNERENTHHNHPVV